jgi:hypothetical protein
MRRANEVQLLNIPTASIPRLNMTEKIKKGKGDIEKN